MFWHPEKITLTESNPGSIQSYQIQVYEDGQPNVLVQNTYPADPSGVTEIPIGSNGLFDNLTAGINIRLVVTEIFGAETGPAQPTDVYLLALRPDGVENILVTY